MYLCVYLYVYVYISIIVCLLCARMHVLARACHTHGFPPSDGRRAQGLAFSPNVSVKAKAAAGVRRNVACAADTFICFVTYLLVEGRSIWLHLATAQLTGDLADFVGSLSTVHVRFITLIAFCCIAGNSHDQD